MIGNVIIIIFLIYLVLSVSKLLINVLMHLSQWDKFYHFINTYYKYYVPYPFVRNFLYYNNKRL